MTSYRSYSIAVHKQDVQWKAEIAPTEKYLPDMLPEKKIIRGWDRADVLARAKSRVDETLSEGHRN